MSTFRWSNSSLSTLQQCGEKFRRRYIEREFTPSSPAAVAGKVVHNSARASLLRKMETRALPSLEETMDRAADDFDNTWRGGVMLSKEEADEGPAKVQARAKDMAVDLSGFHVGRVAPAIEPVGVERKIIVKPRDSDIEINGIIDLIDNTPYGEVIRDLKTSTKSPNANAADTSQQLTMYAMIRMAEVGKLPAALALDYLVRTPEKGLKKHVPLLTTRDGEDVRVLVARINTAVETVKRGLFVPTNPENWWCSAKFCDYYATCVYVRRGNRG